MQASEKDARVRELEGQLEAHEEAMTSTDATAKESSERHVVYAFT